MASHAKGHEYHLVDPSRWPIVGAVSAFVMAVGAIIWMRAANKGEMLFGLPDTTPAWLIFAVGAFGVAVTMFGWWGDVIREAEVEGHHTPVVQLHHRYGMVLFIASEVMFFVAWFWAYFGTSIFAGAEEQVARFEILGGHWPPKGIETFDPMHLPYFNTLLLLTSGTTVTWAHHAIERGDRKGFINGLWLTIILGAGFTAVQAYEYSHAAFAYSGHIYGATFFMATGFHGAHVIIGTIFLTVCLVRGYLGHFRSGNIFGFEAAAWYWHFVDVVWLFLFVSIYVWGAGAGAGGH